MGWRKQKLWEGADHGGYSLIAELGNHKDLNGANG